MRKKSDYEIKEIDDLGFNVKLDGKKKIKPCPFCGKPLETINHGEFLFCKACHKRMPWRTIAANDGPVKDEVID